MANSSFHLYQLQKIDLQQDRNNQQIKKITELLASNPVLKEAEETTNQLKELLHRKSNELKQIEDSAHQKQIKIEQSESALYKGSISNPKELKDLQAEIVSLKKALSQIEEKQLVLMDEVEKLETSVAISTQEYQKILTQSESENVRFVQELESLKRANEKLVVERDLAVKQIASDLVGIYEKLRSSKNRIAVSMIEEEACSACGAEITPSDIQKAKTSTILLFCPTCGRILYAG